MKKIRIGIICPSEIAFRRFMPALKKCNRYEYVGVAVAAMDEWGGEYTDEMRVAELAKAQNFKDNFGGKVYLSYTDLIEDENVDAIYLPLPPALHYEWGKKVLEAGKHLFLEKPSSVSAELTSDLIEMAEKNGLAVHENYMFVFHNQLDVIQNWIDEGKIGELRLIRIAFGFPKRAANDFRYNKSLGGGALLDAGGYTIKLATLLLGDTAKITTSRLNYTNEFDVDIFGSASMENDHGFTAQLSFGMDNCYKCELEVWGSTGTLFANRILTAPAEFEPTIEYKNGNEPVKQIKLEADDTFFKSIKYFGQCIDDEKCRLESYSSIIKQAKLVECIKGDI